MRLNALRVSRRPARRAGMTLLEVIVALAIFLFSLVAISQLFTTATNQAEDIANQSRATRLAQSLLGEYVAGVRSLSSNPSGTFDDEPEWEWSSDVQADSSAQGLYIVTINVSRGTNRGRVETKLSQYVFNPRNKGSIGTTPAATSDSTTTDSTGSTTTNGASNTTVGTATTAPSTGGTTVGGGGNTGGGNQSGGGGNTGGGNTGGGGTTKGGGR